MKLANVTSWADTDIDPDLTVGRWVQLGKPTLLNFWLTGLPGGKFYFTDSFPFIKYVKNQASFTNHIHGFVMVRWPTGFGPDGYIKGLLGQRIIVDNKLSLGI
jgi:hypothetical protein